VTPVATLEEAVDRMVAMDAELARDDGVRHFNLLYLEVTREVVRWVRRGSFAPPRHRWVPRHEERLEDPRFLEHLAVGFSNAYFRAVEGERVATNGVQFRKDDDDGYVYLTSRRHSEAWAPLFDARFDKRVAPIQFALAGMNAHINYDLPIGVRDTCRALGLAPEDGTPHHRDYVRLNAILGEVQQRVKPQLATGLLGVIDRAFGRYDDDAAAFSVARARDAAWVHSKVLWSMREDAQLSASYLLALDGVVGLAGRGLVAPTLLGLGGWVNAQRWLPGWVRPLLGVSASAIESRA
jgi:hypothetical protein